MATHGHVHIIGAGLAGLAAALVLTRAGRAVTLYEAAPQAGGRCRSYLDRAVGRRIDNGNHLVFSGNAAVFRHLRRTAAEDRILIAEKAAFPFFDARQNQRWTLKLSEGAWPSWIGDPKARLPDTKARDYLGLLRLLFAPPAATVREKLGASPLYERLIAPFTIAALNTEPARASARLLRAVLRESLWRGGRFCRPVLPKQDLADALIEPALKTLTQEGAQLRFGARLWELDSEDTKKGRRITRLRFDDGKILLNQADQVILAVPAAMAKELRPEISAPSEFRAIVSVHFAHDLPGRYHEILGILNARSEWVFVRPGILSVTLSAATVASEMPAESLAPELWAETCAALLLGDAPLPPYRVVKEKRATFAATPTEDEKRPGPCTGLPNLFLAGDWTQTGLPSTIEGSLRSGEAAAKAALRAAGNGRS